MSDVTWSQTASRVWQTSQYWPVYLLDKKHTHFPGSKPKWIMAMLAISTQWWSIWSCCSYPRQGSRREVKSTCNQWSTFETIFVKSLFAKQRLERSSLKKLTLHSLMILVMTLYKCRSPTWYLLLRLGLMQEQCKNVSSGILPFFLLTINSGYSEANLSWYAVSMHFFLPVPWTMMELLLDTVWLAVTELLVWRRGAILDFTSDASERNGWWSSLVGLANLDESKAVDTFLEAIGCITKILCSLLLRTCSKDTGATQIGQTTFGGETRPTPASQEHGDTIKQSFCNPMNLSHCDIGIRQVKPSYW